MLNKIKYIIFILLLTTFWSVVLANNNSWGLESVNVISRSDRWADESLRNYDQSEYQKFLKEKDEYQKYLQELNDEEWWYNTWDIQKMLEQQKIYQRRNEYLTTKFEDEFKIDKVVESNNGNKLRWPQSYKSNKTRIVVHHTANDWIKLKSQDEVKAFLRNIYRMHALKNWWWDIWYNFVIDKWWNIYEGRSWWEWVVWAHAKWNNVSSIWISMIWNFENEEPSAEQINALINLATALSIKYGILPYNTVTYHKEAKKDPYITDVNNFSLVGHRDAGFTACPGKNLYARLEYIRQTVNDNIKLVKLVSTQSNISMTDIEKNTINLWKTFYSPKTEKDITVSLNMWLSGNISCSSLDTKLQVNCIYSNWNLIISLKHLSPVASWFKKIVFKDWENYRIIKFWIIFQSDLDYMLNQKKNNYIKAKNFKIASNETQKISYKVNLEEAKSLMNTNVKVLLYDLSTSQKSYDIKCASNCQVKVGGQTFDNLSSFNVFNNEDWLIVTINSQYYEWTDVKIIPNNNSEIQVSNYWRASYAKIPWNTFRWILLFQKEPINILNSWLKTQFVVINELSFDDYMKWIAESSEDQPLEKVKAMTLIIRNYTIFYMNKQNIHPSIPQNAYYNAIDDARIFQKYVGSWFERTVKKWWQALDQTKWQLITYNWFIPVLPYFNCSVWFMWSWKEKYWWTDTPYLSSKLDFAACSDFNWHWVGLSWKWAETLAQKGFDYKTILKYYYDNILIQSVNSLLTTK